jgi:hypothetical protein
MNNSELLEAVYGPLDAETYGWVTNFRADPNDAPMSVWAGRPYKGSNAQASLIDSCAEDNTFYCTAVLKGLNDQGQFRRGKAHFLRLGALVADDADPTQLNGRASYILETSPGKHQLGVLLDADDADCSNLSLVDAVMQAMANANLIKADSSGNNAVRYVRLPVGHNTKKRDSGAWPVKVKEANLNVRYSLADAVGIFGLDLDVIRDQAARVTPSVIGASSGSDYAELIAALAADDHAQRSYHDPLLKLSAKFISSGMHPGAAVEMLRGLMQAVKPGRGDQIERWQSRYDRIPHMVNGAERKYKAPKVEIALQGTDEERQGLLLTLPELGDATKNVRWMVKTLIPADAMGMLFGASGTFKSFVALDLCLHVAHGLQWAKRKTNQGGVVYVAAEGGAGIYRRVRAWHQHHKLSQPDNFHVCVTPLLLAEEDQVSALREAIATLPLRPSLVVVDTLSQTFSGDENSSTDIANYLRLLNTHLRAAFGATVIVVHHTGHMASERPRGSSAITANLDFLLGCFRPNAESLAAQVEVIKQKDGDKLPAQYFELHREVLEKDEDGEEISSLTAAWHDAVAACKESALRLNQYEQAFLDAVKPGDTVSEIEWRKILNEMVDNAATRRSAWKRTVDGLREKRLIKAVAPGTWKRV